MSRSKGSAALRVSELTVEFGGGQDVVHAVSRVSFDVEAGRTLGVVGESGSGKSVTLRTIAGILEKSGRMVGGEIELGGTVLRSKSELEAARGKAAAMIFQDPASTLNPVRPIGAQVSEVLRVKLGHGRRSARNEAEELLGHVGIPEPHRRMRAYPHELSGGMRQRIMIAMAIAARPTVLLADEPTTALDVTTQQQILELLLRLQDETGMALVLVTHDLGVIEEVCDDVVVMYAGYVLERGTIGDLAAHPRHPYTRALMNAMPQLKRESLSAVIKGQPPDPADLPDGCPFRPRCPEATPKCSGVDMDAMSQSSCACPFVGAGTAAMAGRSQALKAGG